jgi:nucleoside-diphosphate-sugar epimerase
VTRVLLTGAAGALGRRVVDLMNSRGDYRLVCTSRSLHPPGDGLRCDVRDASQLYAALESAAPDLVLHLAGAFSGDLDEMYAVNVLPARRILEHVSHASPKTRVVLIGSAAEYGVVRPEENPVREDRVLAPVSTYGVSKAWQTQLLGHYAGRGVNVVCARIFNLFGDGVSSSLFSGRLQRQIAELQAKSRAVIEVGSLTAVRDYVSTDAAADQLLVIAERGATGEIYHVASGIPVTMRDLMLKQLALHGVDPSLVRESPDLSNRVGYDVPVIYADMTKARVLAMDAPVNG